MAIITRHGQCGGPRMPYGVFSGKSSTTYAGAIRVAAGMAYFGGVVQGQHYTGGVIEGQNYLGGVVQGIAEVTQDG